MKPALELNGTAKFLPSYVVVSTVDSMNRSPFSEMKSETSSSQFCAAYSAVQITSVPSTSHSADSACSRCTWSRRCSPASSGSSSSLTFAFGFALLKASIPAPNAPLVSLPMHQVTSPDALACPAFSASAAPPPPSSPSSLPHPAIASMRMASSAVMNRELFNIEFPPPGATFIWALPARGGSYSEWAGRNDRLTSARCLLLVAPLADLLRHLGAEGGEVVRLAARDEAVVHHDLLVDPVASRVADVGLDARPGSDLAVAQDVRLDQGPGAMADRGDRLLRLEEGAHETNGVVVGAQEVGVGHAAGKHECVVVGLAGVGNLLVDLEGVRLVPAFGSKKRPLFFSDFPHAPEVPGGDSPKWAARAPAEP